MRDWQEGSLKRALEDAGFDLLRSRRRGDFLYVRAVKS
jgi:hypothetical protein